MLAVMGTLSASLGLVGNAGPAGLRHHGAAPRGAFPKRDPAETKVIGSLGTKIMKEYSVSVIHGLSRFCRL